MNRAKPPSSPVNRERTHIERRAFLKRAGRGAGAVFGLAACRTSGAAPVAAAPVATAPVVPGTTMDWATVRGEFALDRGYIHLALMLLTSHPRPVRDAIERHRRGLDENPLVYFEERFSRIDEGIRAEAAKYMGGEANHIALTDSTTMSLAVLYGGLHLRAGDEVLTTTHDHYATHENLRLRVQRTGVDAKASASAVTIRKIALYDQPADVTVAEATQRLRAAIKPRTRVVAVTWVHSSTGVKLPIAAFAAAIADINRTRSEEHRVLLCVDGVHGFGVEATSPAELGCDFFAAGCHKWIFGPRGTGVLWGRPEAWRRLTGIIAPFEKDPYVAWMKGEIPSGPPGLLATPGGFHSFEHRWALGEAFAFHQRLGRARVAARIHELAKQCKEGLRAMPHVTLHTPMSDDLSAGLVCFSVRGKPAPEVIKRLHERKILASVTPYATEYARFSPGVLNTPEEIDAVLRALRAMA